MVCAVLYRWATRAWKSLLRKTWLEKVTANSMITLLPIT
jgi:hypothetical protein